MKKFIRAAVFLLAVANALGAESQQPVRGTHVIVTPPSGFVTTDRFPGYLSEESGSSVMVTELPAPFAEVTRGFNAAGFQKQGMTLLSKEEASYGTHNGLLISASQSARGVEFLKWMAVFGDEKTTYLVTASYPKEAEARLSGLLKKTVMGARVSAAPVDPFDALTFRVSPVNDIKIARVLGNGIVLSKGGVFPAKGIDTPILVAVASASKGLTIRDKKAFAEARLQKTATLQGVQSKATDAVTIDGLDGFESTAQATHIGTDAQVMVYQVILFDADGYYVIQGITSEQEAKIQLPTFKQIARTFRKSKAQP